MDKTAWEKLQHVLSGCSAAKYDDRHIILSTPEGNITLGDLREIAKAPQFSVPLCLTCGLPSGHTGTCRDAVLQERSRLKLAYNRAKSDAEDHWAKVVALQKRCEAAEQRADSQLEIFNRSRDQWKKGYDAERQRADTAEAQVRELQADKERLDWAIENEWLQEPAPCGCCYGPATREAIDAARSTPEDAK